MIALARKYRPKSFSDLIAQDHVAAALRGAVAGGRVAHGYLFAGPRGVGKTTAARILAMALNCERRAASGAAGEPCGACDSCTRIWTGAANLDVVELDAASNRGVDDARDLRERAMYAASAEGRRKVYIVDEAHMLTREAWNALLKILEEPPSGVVFVFATTEPQKIAQSAAPILSRLQRFDFRRIGPAAIVARLRQVVAAERLEAADEALHLIAKSADGGMRDGLSILDQVVSFGSGPVTADRVREVLGLIPDDVYGELLRVVAERDSAGVFPLVERLVNGGADLGEFVIGAGDVLRAVLMANLGGKPEGFTEAMQALIERYRSPLPRPSALTLASDRGRRAAREADARRVAARGRAQRDRRHDRRGAGARPGPRRGIGAATGVAGSVDRSLCHRAGAHQARGSGERGRGAGGAGAAVRAAARPSHGAGGAGGAAGGAARA